MPPRGLGGQGLRNQYTTGPQKEQGCATFVITPRFVEGGGMTGCHLPKGTGRILSTVQVAVTHPV